MDGETTPRNVEVRLGNAEIEYINTYKIYLIYRVIHIK